MCLGGPKQVGVCEHSSGGSKGLEIKAHPNTFQSLPVHSRLSQYILEPFSTFRASQYLEPSSNF